MPVKHVRVETAAFKEVRVSVRGKRLWILISVGVLSVAASTAAAIDLFSPGKSRRTSGLTYSDDYLDDRYLAGASNDIFFGKVITKQGEESADRLPEVQYVVQVVEAIKGNLSGEVVVNVFRDEPAVSDSIGNFQSGDVLDPGATYLFATRVYGGWHTASLPLSRRKVSSPQEMDALRSTFREAVAN